jgi:hypothetical protein
MSYWLAAVVLMAFGFVTGFSIGAPFLLVGLAMLVLGPFRGRPRLFWPALLAVIAFVVAVILVIPLSCEATSALGNDSYTVCRSIAGPTWAGPGLYNPPAEAFSLAVLAGLAAGGVAGVVTFTWFALRRRIPRSPASDIPAG